MIRLIGRVTAGAVLSLAVAQAVCAAPCSNQDFKGEYGTIARGTLFEAPPVFAPLLGPVIKVARTIADGNGNVSEVAYATFNGFVVKEQPYFGKYTVNPDCTIVLNWLDTLPIVVGGGVVGFAPDFPLQFMGALGDGGADVLVGITAVASGPPGGVIRVHMRRQLEARGSDNAQIPACSARMLTGGYQLDLFGDVTDTTRYPWPASVPVLAFSRQGTVSFDGTGGFTGNTTASYGGFSVVPEPLNGTYSIDSACNVTMTSTSGAPFTWRGMLTDEGNGAVLVVASPQGAVIGGTLLRQRANPD